jgi:hypothetical protein
MIATRWKCMSQTKTDDYYHRSQHFQKLIENQIDPLEKELIILHKELFILSFSFRKKEMLYRLQL